MSLTITEYFGLGAVAIGVVGGIIEFIKYLKDKPIITITRKDYLRHRKYYELSPKEYANKALRGEFNDGSLNFEVRELVVDVSNKGRRDAELKSILPIYKRKEQEVFSPTVINFSPITIKAGDREPIHLFFEFPSETIKRIEETTPHKIIIEFDFAHKKIKEEFLIGKNLF